MSAPGGGGDDGHGADAVIAKPDELLALHGVTEALFDMLREWFEVPGEVTLDLADIDSAVAELGDPQRIAALAMRKLQALRLLSTPGVRTTTDVVVAIVNDLDRALFQAPSMRLRRVAAETDWDAALAALDATPGSAGPGTDEEVGFDDQAELFAEMHARLHEAALAVVRASEGEIRILE